LQWRRRKSRKEQAQPADQGLTVSGFSRLQTCFGEGCANELIDELGVLRCIRTPLKSPLVQGGTSSGSGMRDTQWLKGPVFFLDLFVESGCRSSRRCSSGRPMGSLIDPLLNCSNFFRGKF